ncbi:MAG: hypothetical protein PWQ12_1349 [Clostridiales bacterium]|nr:hypothetical protein [Clostridiales bacterium]
MKKILKDGTEKTFESRKASKIRLNPVMRKHWLGLLVFLLVPTVYWMGLLFQKYPALYEQLGAGNGLRFWISRLTGLVPFSLGELVVIGHVIFVPIFVILLIVKMIKGGALKWIYHIAVYLALLYIGFMVLWGFNYSRMSIGDMMGLQVRPYAKEELYELTKSLIRSANALRAEIPENATGVMTIPGGYSAVFEEAQAGYDAIDSDIPQLSGAYGRPKPVALSQWMLYTNITGVFFPYTAEANVNVAVPDLLLPATTLHEMAHQRGFAPEDEANFIAYLTARTHPDPIFRYSGTMLALIHAYNALAAQDSASAAELEALFSEGLRRDLDAQNQFWKAYKGKASETAEQVNDAYLKSNHQVDGTKSYGRMVDWLIADYLANGNTSASIASVYNQSQCPVFLPLQSANTVESEVVAQ